MKTEWFNALSAISNFTYIQFWKSLLTWVGDVHSITTQLCALQMLSWGRRPTVLLIRGFHSLFGYMCPCTKGTLTHHLCWVVMFYCILKGGECYFKSIQFNKSLFLSVNVICQDFTQVIVVKVFSNWTSFFRAWSQKGETSSISKKKSSFI